MKFKLEILELLISERPNESSWAFVFLLIFMPDSVHWTTKERFEKVQYFGRVFRECECYLEKNGYCIVEIENVDRHSESDESYDSMFENEKSYDNSPEISSCNEIEYKDTSNVEMWRREEDTYCESTTKFLVCMTYGAAIISSSDYLGYDCNQDEEICERDLLNIDEVSALLQHDFERYASMCDSTFPLLMCAPLKDDVRYDVYPCICSPTYKHCYYFEDF